MQICKNWPVCGILSANKTAGRLGASNTAAAHYPHAKEACMQVYSKRTMPRAWSQYPNLYFGAFCAIMEEALPTNETAYTGVRTTRTDLTLVSTKETTMADPIVPSHQTCTKCGETLPHTTEYFYKRSGKDYLHRYCKSCHNGMTTPKFLQWQKDNPDRAKARAKRYRDKPETRQKKREYQAAYLSNPDNRKRANERNLRWKRANPEKARAIDKKWRSANTDRIYIANANYRTRKRGLPSFFTSQEWQSALDYFNGCCAVCGRQLNDLFGTHTAAADHWIPITSEDCPGTVATNIVPLCHGEGGCNNSKHANAPEQWLLDKFGKREANAILKRIHDYFAWVSGGAE